MCVGTLTLTLQWYTCGFKPCLYFLQYASTCTNLTVLRCCRWHSTLTRRLGIRFSCLDSTCLIRFSFGTWSDVCYAEFLVFDSQEAEQPHECEHEQTINTLSVIVDCFQKKKPLLFRDVTEPAEIRFHQKDYTDQNPSNADADLLVHNQNTT